MQPSYSYGFMGILGLMFGVTPKPSRIDFKCGVCGQTVDTIKDKAELEKFRYGASGTGSGSDRVGRER